MMVSNGGRGVAVDEEEAAVWYRKSAEQGYAHAQTDLGKSYRGGRGVPRDYGEALVWFRKAADQGHAGAQFVLGEMYQKGQGVPQDSDEALAWFRKAADQKAYAAQQRLAGFEKLGAWAASFFRASISKVGEKDLTSQLGLGTMYARGYGVPKNLVIAYALFDLSSSLNDEALQEREKAAAMMSEWQIELAQELAREMARPGNLLKALDDHEEKDQNR
jgi:TPR repeat protein